MIQIAIAYLLPFILIFIFFGNLCVRHQQKSGLKTFFALLIFFGTQFTVVISAAFFIVKFYQKANYLEIISEHGFKINLLAFILASILTYIYYKTVDTKLKNISKSNNNEIETLGEN